MHPYQNLKSFAYSFFDQHSAFKKVANDCGEKTYFLTGATGLFGSWLLQFFDWCHDRKLAEPKIVALVRRDILYKTSYISIIRGTVENFENPNVSFDRLIHLAAPSARDTFKGMADTEKFWQMARGTQNLIDFATKNVSGRSLFLSSGAVYGGMPSTTLTPVDELNRFAPLSLTPGIGLGLGKRVAEFLISDAVRSGLIDASIARCFSFIGPGLPTDLHYAIGNFVSSAVRGRNIVINGDGAPIRSFMDMGDAINWMLVILEQGQSGEDYNVGSKEALSIRELAELVKAVVNPSIDIEIKGVSNLSPGNPVNFCYVPDTTKCENTLSLKSFSNLQKSIETYSAFLRTRNK